MQKNLDSIFLFMAVLINENGGGIFGRHGKHVQSVQVHEANNSEEPGAVIPHRDVGIIFFFRKIYYQHEDLLHGQVELGLGHISLREMGTVIVSVRSVPLQRTKPITS